MLRILSLGAGVQSTTLALMAAAGELPPFDAAIFADTQSEPADVYRHLDWLEPRLPYPVYRVTAGSLKGEIFAAMSGAGQRRLDARPPFYTLSGGMLRRQCTQDYKVRPIQRKIRELAGIVPRSPGPRSIAVVQVMGISLDEATRMRSSDRRWIQFEYPLVERRLTRSDCLAWLEARGFPRPPKSACTFCPYHNAAMWRDMKRDDPASFAEAVAVDEAIRPGMAGPKRPANDQWFVHRSLLPLASVDFSTLEDRGQLNLFNNECAGVCGV